MSKFSCYSANEKLTQCANQCQFCKQHFHLLPGLTKKYKITVTGNQEQDSIILYAPQHLLNQVKVLKKEDPAALRQAIVELMIDNIDIWK